MLKTLGYLISTLSVLLLAVPAIEGAMRHPGMLVVLIAGASMSILGMFLRWLSFLRDHRDKPR